MVGGRDTDVSYIKPVQITISGTSLGTFQKWPQITVIEWSQTSGSPSFGTHRGCGSPHFQKFELTGVEAMAPRGNLGGAIPRV